MSESVERFKLIRLHPDQAPELEQKLLEDPFDLRSRLQLVDHYLRVDNDDRFGCHLIWLIANKPEIDFKHCNIWVGIKHIEVAEAAWSQAMEKDPNNLTILRNAISCCSLLSKGAVKEWRERGYRLEPLNEEWPNQLSFTYYLGTLDTTFDAAKPNAIKSVRLAREAIELYKQFPKDGYFRDNLLASSERSAAICFSFDLIDDAQYFGDHLIEHGHEQQKAGSDQHLLKHVSQVHIGHSIVGRVALRKNDVEQTLFHLAKMPLLIDLSFQHDLLFAQALLERGRIDSVCAYLDDCITNLSAILGHMVEGDPFYTAILRNWDMPMEGPGYLFDNLRDKISMIEEWKTAIREERKIVLPAYV
jgi:hypothetical protein